MLRTSLNASRLFVPRTIIRSSNPHQALVCNRHTPVNNILGSRSMAVAASANSSDAPLITPGTPISTPTLIDIDRRWLELNAQQQLDIFKALHEREKEPWYTMTTEERKACTSSAQRFSIQHDVNRVGKTFLDGLANIQCITSISVHMAQGLKKSKMDGRLSEDWPLV
jgi:hypothetical protein